MKKKVIAIVGPTAVGKTSLSVELAKAIDGEVISADSRQVYRGLDIGSGKVTKEEMNGVPHHLLDVAAPKEVFTASDFVRLGRTSIDQIIEKSHTPLIVGGTGFYVDALVGRVALAEVAPNQMLRTQLSKCSLEELQEMLKKRAPERFELIDQKNPVRLIRAIEIAESENPDSWKLAPEILYDVLWIGLTVPMDKLKEKIALRLHERFEHGMLDEAKQLHADGLSYERMEELGLEYRYMARHLEGAMGYEEMIQKLEIEIGKYAKRQMTWLKRNDQIHWITPGETKRAIGLAQNFLSGR